MRGKQTIVINGKAYDALTGMPVHDETPAQKSTPHTVAAPVKPSAAQAAPEHNTRTTGRNARHKPHRSTTLRRDIVNKPEGKHVVASQQPRAHVSRSGMISKFAPHPSKPEPIISRSQPVSPIVASAHAKVAAHPTTTTVPRSSRELKNHLIRQQIDNAPTHHAAPKKQRRAPLRVSSVMAACLGLMILGGYLSYINMPNLSVRVAAAQAGVNAKYPGYTPSGYRFDGPVAYSNGTVSLGFAANGGTASYEINQKKSNWDSQAVLDNFVVAQSDQYSVNDIQGLTIYTYENNAAWVNRGVLYTISGNAPLRTDQVLKIATSL